MWIKHVTNDGTKIINHLQDISIEKHLTRLKQD